MTSRGVSYLRSAHNMYLCFFKWNC